MTFIEKLIEQKSPEPGTLNLANTAEVEINKIGEYVLINLEIEKWNLN